MWLCWPASGGGLEWVVVLFHSDHWDHSLSRIQLAAWGGLEGQRQLRSHLCGFSAFPHGFFLQVVVFMRWSHLSFLVATGFLLTEDQVETSLSYLVSGATCHHLCHILVGQSKFQVKHRLKERGNWLCFLMKAVIKVHCTSHMVRKYCGHLWKHLTRSIYNLKTVVFGFRQFLFIIYASLSVIFSAHSFKNLG